MDIIFSPTIKRHLRKLQHECEQLLQQGVSRDEIDSHNINVKTFGRGESISESEIENIKRLYKYLADKNIAVRNLPLRPSVEDGTLDYVGNAKAGIEYITVQYVTVFDYESLDKFVDKKVFNITSVSSPKLDHLIGRALTFDGADFKYHGNKLKLGLNSNAFDYLRAILILAKSEESAIDCIDIAEMCNKSPEGFTKILKDSLQQTILPRLKRYNEKSKQYDFSIDTKRSGVILVRNPKWYKPS